MELGKIELPPTGPGCREPHLSARSRREHQLVQWLALISQRLNFITRELDGLLMDQEGRGGLGPLDPQYLPESMEELAQCLAAKKGNT